MRETSECGVLSLRLRGWVGAFDVGGSDDDEWGAGGGGLGSPLLGDTARPALGAVTCPRKGNVGGT